MYWEGLLFDAPFLHPLGQILGFQTVILAAGIAAVGAVALVALDGGFPLDVLLQELHQSLDIGLLAVHGPVVGALIAADAAGAHHLGLAVEHLLDGVHLGNDIGTGQAVQAGVGPMEMSMWLAPPKARLAAGTLGTIFS